MPTYRVLAAALFVIFAPAMAAETARAADFRIDNSVFADGQSQPQSQGVTIFYKEQVYDFLNDPAEVIVFDKAHRRFILLDITRHLRSEITINDVQDFANRVKQRMSGHSKANVKWLADPVFEESFDRESNRLTLKSPTMTYQVQLQAVGPSVAAQYREFSDSYAQFNFALDTKSRPPFPRMMLNEAIERYKAIAREVHLTVATGPSDSPMRVTSRHQFAAQLDSTDVSRVKEAQEYMHSFQSVYFREYRQGK